MWRFSGRCIAFCTENLKKLPNICFLCTIGSVLLRV